jgi:hypothetical protein
MREYPRRGMHLRAALARKVTSFRMPPRATAPRPPRVASPRLTQRDRSGNRSNGGNPTWQCLKNAPDSKLVRASGVTAGTPNGDDRAKG